MNPDLVRVEGARLPLGHRRFTLELPADLSVAQLVEQCLDTAMRRYARVEVGGELVPEECWERVRLRPGQTATMYVVPGFAPPAGSGFFTAFAIAALNLGISILVSYGINQLTAPEPEDHPVTTSHSLIGGTNRLRPYGVIPRVFGRLRFAPPSVNPWVVRMVHNAATGRTDQSWLRGLLCWGSGAVAISDIKIDQTPIVDISSVAASTEQLEEGGR